jgi:pyruvate formate lyase activating enzyme
MTEAWFYKKLTQDNVQCQLCPHACVISPGRFGQCRVRQNVAGVLYSLVSDQIIATHVDPIEKKPLYHVLPGSRSFSIATVGCNFRCDFCQNYHISQQRAGEIPAQTILPAEIVALAKTSHCRSIAYTYTEPTIYFELAFACARLAHEQGLLNVFVTNGYINPEPLEMIRPYLDAANVDLKAFDENFYQKYTGGKLSSVLQTLKLMQRLKIFIEVTTLIIPQLNDDKARLFELAKFIKDELGADTPWHISRFFPQYKMQQLPPTPESTIRQACEIGKAAGLRYVYAGNLAATSNENTYCFQCGELLIERLGYQIHQNRVESGKCPACGTPVAGIFDG